MKPITAFLAVCLMLGSPSANTGEPESGAGADAVLGEWWTEDRDARVRLERSDGVIRGRIVWLEEPVYPPDDPGGMAGQPRVDRENSDPAKRDRPVIGLTIVDGFVYEGDGEWEEGTVYDPENGKRYDAEMWLEGEDTLMLRGYIGISLFGRTAEWSRVSDE